MEPSKPQDRVSGDSYKLSMTTSESLRLVTVEVPPSGNEIESQETFIVRLFHDDIDPEKVVFIHKERGLIDPPDPATKLEAEKFNERLTPLQQEDIEVYWVRPQVEFFCKDGVVYSKHKIDICVPVDNRERWVNEKVDKIAERLDATREHTGSLHIRNL